MASRESDPQSERTVIPAIEETVEVGKRTTTTGALRVARKSRQHQVHVNEPLEQEEVDVERVPVNRIVTTAPPVRQEGDTTIIPVLEEQVIVEKRLLLREELHVTKRRKQSRFVADIPAHYDEVVVERDQTNPGDGAAR